MIRMRAFTVRISNLKMRDRLVPSFYFEMSSNKSGYISKPINDFAFVSDGQHAHNPRNNVGGIRYLYGRNIKEQSINYDPISDDSYIDENVFDSDNRCHVKNGDLLIAILGTVGKSVVYNLEKNGVLGIPRHIARITLRKNTDDINLYFLSCYFRNRRTRKEVEASATGNIQKLLSLKTIRATKVPLPDKPLLSTITSNEIEALNLQYEFDMLLEKAKKLFYESIPFNVKAVPDESFFSIKSTDVKKNDMNLALSKYRKLYVNTIAEIMKVDHFVLSDEFSIATGVEVGSKEYIPYVESSSSSIPFIRTSDIVNYYPDFYTDFFVKSKPSKYSLLPRDVAFTKDGKIGCCAYIGDNTGFIFSSGFSIFRKIKGKNQFITPEYLFIALSILEIGTFQGLKGTVVASTIPHLRKQNIQKFVIPLINKEKINKITTIVQLAFSKRERKNELLKIDDCLMNNFLEKIRD